MSNPNRFIFDSSLPPSLIHKGTLHRNPSNLPPKNTSISYPHNGLIVSCDDDPIIPNLTHPSHRLPTRALGPSDSHLSSSLSSSFIDDDDLASTGSLSSPSSSSTNPSQSKLYGSNSPRVVGSGADGDIPSDYGEGDHGDDGDRWKGGSGGNGNGRDNGGDESNVRSAFSDDQDSKSDDESTGDASDDSEDDIPLAQRIPGALQAQKSIRIKAKADKERKRKERHTQKQQRAHPALSLPSPRPGPIAADDLAQKLLQVRDTSASESRQEEVSPHMTASQQSCRTVPPQRHPAVLGATSPPPRHVFQEMNKMGHIHHETASAPLSRKPTATRPRNQSLGLPIPRPSSPSSRAPAPSVVPQPLSRSVTTGHHRHPSTANDSQFLPTSRFPPHEVNASLVGSQKSDSIQFNTQPDGVRRGSHDVPRQGDIGPRSRTMSSSVTSGATPPQRVLQRARPSTEQPSRPIPVMSQEVKRQPQDPNAIQHRVFIGDMQRFNTVEIGPHTRARDVLDLVKAQGELRSETAAQSGGWMLWELAQDFGMERPLREYELPAEVYASWNSNTRLNAFMIKKTPLAPLLARKAMPSSSPMFGGYIQWESKRGKWNKRWMELREHSLWLSKRDNGKDSTFLCSLSNFDCYYVSRLHKAPRPFIFAVKSTDNLTLFENPADYLHIFSCDTNDGQRWMERILLARSYVLHKERTILFSPPAPPSSITAVNASQNPNSSKSSSSSRVAAPLINVSTLQVPAGPSSTTNPFQSGSLLAKTSV